MDKEDLLKKRDFSYGPWILKIILMTSALTCLVYLQIKMLDKTNEKQNKKPSFTIPASRQSSGMQK